MVIVRECHLVVALEAYSRCRLHWVAVIGERTRVVATGGNSTQVASQTRLHLAYVATEVRDIRMTNITHNIRTTVRSRTPGISPWIRHIHVFVTLNAYPMHGSMTERT